MHPWLLIETSIGARRTRLLPAICFDPLMLAEVHAMAPCVLGLPPPRLLTWHWPALMNECVARLRAVMADPVSVEHDGDVYRVSMLGVLVLERDGEGLWRTWQWMVRGIWEPAVSLARVPEREVVALGLPCRDLWARRFAHGMAQALAARLWLDLPERRDDGGVLKADAAGIAAYAAWVVKRAMACLWTEPAAAAVRAKVAAALCLDPRLQARASRRHARRQGINAIRLDGYNRMVWRARHWPRIRQQTPQFMPLLEVLWHRLPTAGDPLQNLKLLLKADGITAGMWVALHRAGTRWMMPLLRYYTRNARASGAAALDLVRVAQLFGRPRVLPVWMIRAVVNEVGNPHRPRANYADYWKASQRLPLLRRLGRWCADLQDRGEVQQLGQLRRALHLVLHWAYRNPEEVQGRWMRQTSLQGLLQRALRWYAAFAAQTAEGAAWTSRWDLREIAGKRWRIVELTSAWDILEEGRAMHHCADTYMSACSEGKYVLLSVRDGASGRRLATVGIHMDGLSICLDQVAGFANARVPPELAELARRCCEHMHEDQRRAHTRVRLLVPSAGRP